MKHMKLLSCLLVFLLSASLFSISAAAKEANLQTSYESYEYNSDDKSVAAPDGYYLVDTIDGSKLGLDTEFSQPSDFVISRNGDIYLLDSGNSRIVVTDEKWKVKRVIEHFSFVSGGEEFNFSGASGLTVSNDGSIYIADTSNQRIIAADGNGGIKQIIGKPETNLINESVSCNYTKVLLDKEGRLYAIADDVNIGAMVFMPDGSFKTFYGSNPIVKTADVIKKYLMRRFMSQTQLKGSLQYTAVNFTNFDIGPDGFIYTVTKDESRSDITPGMVRKLNISGSDILSGEGENEYGDLEIKNEDNSSKNSQLIDIEVDNEGFMFLLDSTRGRIFLYSQEDGIMMTAFGGLGVQKGLFKNPIALESANGFLYVLDKENACIYVFAPTEYMITFRAGVMKLESGDYNGAYELFNKILSFNTNNETAYLGIGKALDAQGKYKEAMSYFKKAYAQSDYSNSFEQYRKIFVREHFVLIFSCILTFAVFICVAAALIKKKLAVKKGETYSGWESRRLFPFYTMRHPADGFAQFRVRKIMSWFVSAIIIAYWFFIEVADYFYLGFPFNSNRPENYRLIYTVLQTVGAFLLFVCANYAICTLLEGKGTFKEIFAGTAYSLLPMLICKVIALLMSQVMAINESAFIQIVLWIGIIWSGVLLFIALSTIHQFSFLKTVACVLLTFMGMLIALFLIILFYSLMSQLFVFLDSVKTELSLR